MGGQGWSLAWASDQAGLARSSPATQAGWVQPSHMGRVGPSAQKKLFFTNYFKRICDFLQIFLVHFKQYWFVFLYYKDTNPVLKYQVFIKTLNFFFKKTRFYFMHTAKYLKKNISYFHTTKIQKYVLTCILVLITSLLKLRKLGQYFKNSKKIIFFLLVSGVTTLYVRCISDIKFFC